GQGVGGPGAPGPPTPAARAPRDGSRFAVVSNDPFLFGLVRLLDGRVQYLRPTARVRRSGSIDQPSLAPHRLGRSNREPAKSARFPEVSSLSAKPVLALPWQSGYC